MVHIVPLVEMARDVQEEKLQEHQATRILSRDSWLGTAQQQQARARSPTVIDFICFGGHNRGRRKEDFEIPKRSNRSRKNNDKREPIRSTPCCRLNKRKTKRTRECCFSITSFVTSASSIEFQLDELSPHIMVLVYWHFNAVIQHPPPRISCSLLPSHKTRRTTSSTTYFKRRLSR